MSEKISVLISSKETEARIKTLAEQINQDFAGQSVHLIGILKGSVFFLCELAKHLTIPTTMDFISCHSYQGTTSTGTLTFSKKPEHSLEGRNVILVEDIVDTGNTLSILIPMLMEMKPACLKLATLLDKPSRRIHPEIKIDYLGFTIDDLFVVGYGLDYDQQYRTLPFIGIVEQDSEGDKKS